ncbi:putative T7SS-secreted protein [Amycolatopsis sp. NPDC049688]|uniref:putative T7SS-secreted protein n=1 Tax=Amycolatopsis sp. NPDC049688 TaxID=3154733 RepID=UPI003422F0B6
MAGELGETSDPEELVPGDAGAVTSTLNAMRAYGDALHEAGEGLRKIDTSEGWTGPAGDAFRAAFDGQPGKWLEAGDCFHQAATALEAYASTLTWAQGQAAEAIRQWNDGEAATGRAKAEHQQDEQKAGHRLPFDDSVGEGKRAAARGILARARGQLKSAGDTADRTVGAARDKAPEKPGFWSKLWDGVTDIASDVGATLENVAGAVVNTVASVGNAMIHHPGDVALAALGGLTMAAGAGGEALGGLLDATVVLAPAGVAVNVGSTALIGLGATTAAVAGGDLLMHAASDDSVSPMRTDHTGSSGGDGLAPREVNRPDSVPEVKVDGKQFGTKVGKHAQDYGLNPADAESRAWVRQHVDDISRTPNEVRQGPWNPQGGGGGDYYFLRKGEDVVVTKSDGTFVTILKGGQSNGWFNGATPVK